jgi:gliding motility-associated-like protein
MTGGLGLAPTASGGFVGTGQHNGAAGGGCDSYVYKLNTCGELLWYKTYGTAGSDGGRKVVESIDGGLLVAGLFDSDGGNGYDYFLQKLDANGNQTWLTVWNNTAANSGDYAHWVEETPSNIFVSGSTNAHPWGGWNAVISSYTLGGVHQWTKAFGGGGEDNFCSIHAVQDGVIAGGITASFGSGNRDLFVTKVGFGGNVMWMNAYGTTGNEGGYWDTEGLPTPDGGYLMTGSTNTAGLTAGGMDILLIKLDSTGVVEWAKTYGGPNNDWSEGLVLSPDGGYAVVATSHSYTNGGRDASLLKVDSVGNFQWANSYGQAGCDRGVDVMAKDGGYVLSMNYNNSLAGCGVNNEYDPMFIKTDSLGNCGCSFINAPYASMDVTASIVTTAIDTVVATQYITPNLHIESPPIIVDNPNITENTICTVCSNVTPQWGYNDTIGCHGDTLKFYNTTASSVGCFYWDNTVNYSSNGDTILFVLDSTQGLTQDVALISVCGNTVDTLKQRVTIVQPQANFLIPNTCLSDTTLFVDNSSVNIENIVSWQWDYGDGTSSTNANDNHLYASEGDYLVELIVATNHGCADTMTSTITKFPMPQAMANLSNECLIDSLFFENASTITATDAIVGWAWDFGDGNFELGEDVYHTYAADGSYEVKLVTVSNNFCADTLIDTVVVYPMPQTNFTLTNECLYDSLALNDLSTINAPDLINAWEWSYGDGQTSNQQNNAHLYALDGAYEITLLTTSNHGCSDTLRDSVVIYPVPLTNFSLVNQCQIDTFSFGDLSTINGPDSITAWNWNFGDGNGGLNQNESHHYSNDGTYQVTLITTSNNNCYDTLALPLVVYPMPQANFSIMNQCIAEEYAYNSTSTINAPDNIIGWEWTYGDGNGSMQENDTHYYSSNGNYEVSLVTISDNGCRDTLVDSITVYPMPNSVFNLSNLCLTDTVNVSDLSIINAPDNIPVRQWDFGDGSNVNTDSSTFHVYQTSGTFDVSLITISNNDCRDTLVQTVVVHPLPNVNFTTSNACINEQPITFTNNSTIVSGSNVGYSWSFGDTQNSMSTQENPSFHYPSHGIYDVQLIVTSDLNCQDSLTQTVQVYHKPTAYFLQDTTEGCAPLCVTFNSISNDSLGIADWNWQFENSLGEGSSKYVGYCYEGAGTYDVTLIVQNTEGCYDTIVKPALITTYPFPTADFELTPSTTTVQEPNITFTNLSVDAVSWVWDFADGTLDSIHYDPAHDYQDTGVYNISLTVYNDIGCPNTVYHQLIVLPIENIFVPSAFSPNGDGENDELFVRGYAQAMYFTVYDRWGKKVFETNNQNVGWDGTIHEKPAVEGVYMWYLQTSFNGENKVYKGDVSLFR